MKFAILCLVLASPFASPAGAATEPPCRETGKLYKTCGDQRADFQKRLVDAKSQDHLLVVVLGAEWCPWCHTLHDMLGDPRFAKGFAPGYELTAVTLYDGKTKFPAGEAVLKQIKEQAHFERKIDGIPVLAVVNPRTGKATLIDTEPLEKNTATKKGHDPAKVLAALEKAQSELR